MNILVVNLEKRGVGELVFSDLDGLSNTLVIKESFIPPNNKLLSFLHRIHYSQTINTLFRLPFKNIWKSYYPLKNIKFLPENQYYIVFLESTISKYALEDFEALRKQKNVHILFLPFNPMIGDWYSNVIKTCRFEKVLSVFNEEDIKKYNTVPIKTIYSKIISPEYSEIKNDLFYIGMVKDRFDIIEQCIHHFAKNEVKLDFTLFDKDAKNIKTIKDVKYITQFIPYKDVVNQLQHSNCLLEICQKNQQGWTLRTFEAIVFNKKLLTNNKYITRSEYYNPKYMRYFNSVEDIDTEFIKERISVDYGYKGEFSPIHLLDAILSSYREIKNQE